MRSRSNQFLMYRLFDEKTSRSSNVLVFKKMESLWHTFFEAKSKDGDFFGGISKCKYLELQTH